MKTKIDSCSIAIPCKALSFGDHTFDFQIDDAFFRAFDNTEIDRVAIEVRCLLSKTGSDTMDLAVDISGELEVPCDRCLAPLRLPVAFHANIGVVFSGTSEAEESVKNLSDKEILYFPADAAEVDLGQYVYDSICLSLPLRRIHPEGGCDPEMMKIWKEHAIDNNI